MKWIQAAWRPIKRVLHGVGRVQTAILLTLFYWVVVGPVSIVLRWGRTKLLNRKPHHSLPTYWLSKMSSRTLGENLRRQF